MLPSNRKQMYQSQGCLNILKNDNPDKAAWFDYLDPEACLAIQRWFHRGAGVSQQYLATAFPPVCLSCCRTLKQLWGRSERRTEIRGGRWRENTKTRWDYTDSLLRISEGRKSRDSLHGACASFRSCVDRKWSDIAWSSCKNIWNISTVSDDQIWCGC